MRGPFLSLITRPSVQLGLHTAQGAGGLCEAGLLFERVAVVARGVERAVALLVDAPEVEVREGVRLVARGGERAAEPAHARPEVALRDEVAADVVVGVAEGGVNPNRLQALVDGLVVAPLEAVDPPQKGVRL